MATFVELTEIEYPMKYNNQDIIPMDGTSFLPLLKGEELLISRPIFWQWNEGKAIREGDWKLVAHKGVWKLYNLKSDPVEEIDLSDSNRKMFEQLKNKYETWESQFEM